VAGGGNIRFEKEGFAQWLDHKQHVLYVLDKNSIERLLDKLE
jgi:hypothetical protein